MGVVGCEKGAAAMGGDGLSLAGWEGLKLWEGGKLSGTLADCQRVAVAGEGGWL